MNADAAPKLTLPRHAPVMVLPGVALFPDALVPLFIFEPRYRAMLEWSLERERMFCLALIRDARAGWTTPADFHPIAGIGLVRACVGGEDGTSQLILQGLARVEFTGFVQAEPFIVAEVREIPSVPAASAESAALTATVLDLCAEYRARGLAVADSLDRQLGEIEDPGVLADMVAHTFIRDAYRRQTVLEAGEVLPRLRTLIGHLREELD